MENYDQKYVWVYGSVTDLHRVKNRLIINSEFDDGYLLFDDSKAKYFEEPNVGDKYLALLFCYKEHNLAHDYIPNNPEFKLGNDCVALFILEE